jgi:hypothetical protein
VKKQVIGVFIGVLLFGMVLSAHADTITLYAVSDAEITGTITGSYVNTQNWGELLNVTGNINRTGGPTSAQFSNTGDSRGLFEFDLSSIPAGATINSATVSLYINFNAFSPLTSRITSVSLYQVTSDWTEMGVTYDTRPTWNTTQVASMSIPAATGTIVKTPFNGYINGNITNLVQAWLDGGDSVNFGLATSDTMTTAGLLRISAHEAGGILTSQDPRLVVTYTLAPSPVPIPPTVWLLGTGLIGLVGLRRKRYLKK